MLARFDRLREDVLVDSITSNVGASPERVLAHFDRLREGSSMLLVRLEGAHMEDKVNLHLCCRLNLPNS